MNKVGLLLLILFLLSPLPVNAAGRGLVTDGAGLLTDEELKFLNSRAVTMSELYQCDVAIITVEDMGNNEAFDYADWLREEYGIGHGPEGSCLLLFLSMAERDYALLVHGYGAEVFTVYGQDKILDDYVLPLLGDDEYYDAFSIYLYKAEEYLAMARGGTVFKWGTDPDAAFERALLYGGLIVVLPLAVAFIICQIWKGQMKTARLATTADSYIPEGGFELTVKEDTFLYRTVTRRKIERESSSSGSRHSSSSGSSGRSGKF